MLVKFYEKQRGRDICVRAGDPPIRVMVIQKGKKVSFEGDLLRLSHNLTKEAQEQIDATWHKLLVPRKGGFWGSAGRTGFFLELPVEFKQKAKMGLTEILSRDSSYEPIVFA